MRQMENLMAPRVAWRLKQMGFGCRVSCGGKMNFVGKRRQPLELAEKGRHPELVEGSAPRAFARYQPSSDGESHRKLILRQAQDDRFFNTTVPSTSPFDFAQGAACCRGYGRTDFDRRYMKICYSFATRTERMPESASISLTSSGVGRLSRLSTPRALPPVSPRLSDMLAMLILCLASSVPIHPTMPGRSLFSTMSRIPSGLASRLWPLSRTMRGCTP